LDERKKTNPEKVPALAQESPSEYQVGARKFVVTKITLPRRVATALMACVLSGLAAGFGA
jgi:hypothetical protein